VGYWPLFPSNSITSTFQLFHYQPTNQPKTVLNHTHPPTSHLYLNDTLNLPVYVCVCAPSRIQFPFQLHSTSLSRHTIYMNTIIIIIIMILQLMLLPFLPCLILQTLPRENARLSGDTSYRFVPFIYSFYSICFACIYT
jgi:hypothetical protein